MSEFTESKESTTAVERFVMRLAIGKQVEKKQLERFHKNYSSRFDIIIEKIIAKYETPEYTMRWIKRGKEPPETLLWFLFEYAQKYGRPANENELLEYSNPFTAELYFVNGYYFELMMGQGAALKVYKP